MKRIGLIILLILLLSVCPVGFAQSEKYIVQENGLSVHYYKRSAGYDQILRPDGSVLVYNQRYIIEYLNGKNWKQIMTPFSVSHEGNTITRGYMDYLGTTGEVIYRRTEAGIKSDVVIKSAITREYRIKWVLDGVALDTYQIIENGIRFYNGAEWVTFDWSDAYNEYGSITDYTVSDSANGKKLEIVFNIGTVEAGAKFVLDPVVIDQFYQNTGTFNLEGSHPSGDADRSAFSQCFNTTESLYLAQAIFELREVNAPTGNAVARLYAMTGTYGLSGLPTGAALATSDPVDISTIGGVFTNVTFKFTDNYLMDANTSYCIVYENPAAGVDNVDYIRTTIGNGATGNGGYYDNTGWNQLASDFIFEVDGVENYMQLTDQNATTTFSKDEAGWFNVTVFDWLGVADINTVDLQVNTSGAVNNFTLRWTQVTDTFSEVTDPDNIITLNAASVRTNINTTHDKICYNFNFTGGESGLCDVRVTVTSDTIASINTTYADAFTFSYFNWVDEVYDYINSAFNQFGIVNYMGSITTFITGLSTWFTTSLTRILTLLTQQFQVINAVFGWFIYWSGEMIDIVLQFSTYYHEFLDGTSAWSDALVPWWEFFMGFSDAFPLFGFIWWIGSLGPRGRQTVGGALQVIINDMNTAIGLFSYFFGVFSFVANTIIDRVYGLFDALP